VPLLRLPKFQECQFCSFKNRRAPVVVRGHGADKWYYADGGGQPRGPLSLAELLPLLARIADPRRVMVWRHGFDDWKPVEEVRELAQQLFRPPPLKPTPPPIPVIRERVVATEEAAEFKDVKPELSESAAGLVSSL
jgi:GYF domain 2